MIHQAIPLLLSSLDARIRKLGGRGYNCDVKATKANGYSVSYQFYTDKGTETLITENVFQVGTLVCEDEGRSTLCTIQTKLNLALSGSCKLTEKQGAKILVHSWLGATFPAAMAELPYVATLITSIGNRITPPPTIYC